MKESRRVVLWLVLALIGLGILRWATSRPNPDVPVIPVATKDDPPRIQSPIAEPESLKPTEVRSFTEASTLFRVVDELEGPVANALIKIVVAGRIAWSGSAGAQGLVTWESRLDDPAALVEVQARGFRPLRTHLAPQVVDHRLVQTLVLSAMAGSGEFAFILNFSAWTPSPPARCQITLNRRGTGGQRLGGETGARVGGRSETYPVSLEAGISGLIACVHSGIDLYVVVEGAPTINFPVQLSDSSLDHPTVVIVPMAPGAVIFGSVQLRKETPRRDLFVAAVKHPLGGRFDEPTGDSLVGGTFIEERLSSRRVPIVANDGDGTSQFEIAGMAAGRYELGVVDRLGLFLHLPEVVEIPGPGSYGPFELEVSGSGRVRMRATYRGQPIRVRLALRSTEHQRWRSSIGGDDGVVEVSDIQPGTYRLSVAGDKLLTQWEGGPVVNLCCALLNGSLTRREVNVGEGAMDLGDYDLHSVMLQYEDWRRGVLEESRLSAASVSSFRSADVQWRLLSDILTSDSRFLGTAEEKKARIAAAESRVSDLVAEILDLDRKGLLKPH